MRLESKSKHRKRSIVQRFRCLIVCYWRLSGPTVGSSRSPLTGADVFQLEG
jgi:hypothetical protein